MSNSNLELCKANRANEISELKDLTKYRLDELIKQKNISTLKLTREKILLKKLVNTLLLLIMQTKFLLHYLHRLTLQVLLHMQRLLEYLQE